MELSELKEKNAAEAAAGLAASESTETTEVVETEETEAGEVTVEPWMQEEEAEEQTSEDPSKSVPVGKFVSLKKELRGKISDRDEEIERLRSERDSLRLANPEQKTSLKRPVANDFTTDEEYEFALSKYDEDRLQDTYNRNRKKEQQDESQRQAQETISQAMDAHYDQADELMKTSGIALEKYVAASTQTKAVFTDLFGNGGTAVFENVFAKLGKGSEKLEYFIGVNKAAQEKVKSLIKSDPLGISLAMWLGQEKQRLSKPIKPRSKAPDPAATVQGDAVPTGEEAKLKKAYDKAGAGNTASWKIKQQAKKLKIDVSKW